MTFDPNTVDFGGNWHAWHPWKLRDRPSKDLDVPKDFGLLGIYLLATECVLSDVSFNNCANSNLNIPEQIIYIGMSANVETRLEASHKAVRQYKTKFSDTNCQNLYFSTWHSGATNNRFDKKQLSINKAKVALHERWLLYLYAMQHGHLPALNRM